MASEPKRIHISPETDLGTLLKEADQAPVVLEKDGVLYRLTPAAPEDVWAGYDPQAVKRALRQSAGAFAGMDTAQFKRELREQRSQDSHGRPA